MEVVLSAKERKREEMANDFNGKRIKNKY